MSLLYNCLLLKLSITFDLFQSFTMSNVIVADDEQVFLERNLELLNAMGGGSGGGSVNMSGTSSPLNAASSLVDGYQGRLTPSGSLSSSDMLEDVSQKLARLSKLKVCKETHQWRLIR